MRHTTAPTAGGCWGLCEPPKHGRNVTGRSCTPVAHTPLRSTYSTRGIIGDMTMTDTPSRPAPRKRRSKTVRRLVITFIVLIGLLVVADFSAAAIFEYQVSKRARDQFDLADDPA